MDSITAASFVATRRSFPRVFSLLRKRLRVGNVSGEASEVLELGVLEVCVDDCVDIVVCGDLVGGRRVWRGRALW